MTEIYFLTWKQDATITKLKTCGLGIGWYAEAGGTLRKRSEYINGLEKTVSGFLKMP